MTSMRLAFLFAFAMSLYLWVSDSSNAQGLKESAEQRSDKQLIDQADKISNLYESLFTRIRASAVLPIHIGYRQPLFISVNELVKRIDAEDWDKPTRNALSAFLDNLYLDTRAGLFFLDAEALARVTRRPEEYRRRISRKSPMDAWGDDSPKYTGDEGAKQFAERRLALEGALSQLSRDEQRGLWLKFARHVYLRNETRSQADLERIKSLTEKMLRDATGLSTEERREAVKLDITWDKESSIRRRNEVRFGANQHFTKLLSEASVSEIFQSSMRRPASKDSISRIRNDLLRVIARIKSSLETDPIHRLKGVQLVVSEIPQVLSGNPLDHLWLKATLSDNSPKIVASGPAILLAYGVCSARSYQISAWNFRGLLAGSNVREASDTPYDRVLEFLRSDQPGEQSPKPRWSSPEFMRNLMLSEIRLPIQQCYPK